MTFFRDPVFDVLASIDASPSEVDAAIRRHQAEAAAWRDFGPTRMVENESPRGTYSVEEQERPTADAIREHLGTGDPAPALRLLLNDHADTLARSAPYALRGLTPDAARSLPFFADHLRRLVGTRDANPEYHAHRLAEADAMIHCLADLDAFAAERRAVGDDPGQAIIRLLTTVRAVWRAVPGAMKNAPPGREPNPAEQRWLMGGVGRQDGDTHYRPTADFNTPTSPIPGTLRKYVAAHVAHAGRLRRGTPRPRPSVTGPRALVPSVPPDDPTRPVLIGYAAKHWFNGCKPSDLKAWAKSGRVKAARFRDRLYVFDHEQVCTRTPRAREDAKPDAATEAWWQSFGGVH